MGLYPGWLFGGGGGGATGFGIGGCTGGGAPCCHGGRFAGGGGGACCHGAVPVDVIGGGGGTPAPTNEISAICSRNFDNLLSTIFTEIKYQ